MHKRHRSTAFLAAYMARVRTAAKVSSCNGDATELALAKTRLAEHGFDRDMAGLKPVEEVLRAHKLPVKLTTLMRLASRVAHANMAVKLPLCWHNVGGTAELAPGKSRGCPPEQGFGRDHRRPESC